jgi:hypothetical protein
MSPHAVAKYSLSSQILEMFVTDGQRVLSYGTYNRETCVSDNLREFNSDVRVHVIVFGIFRICRIQVEASPGAKVPVIVFALDSGSSWGRVWE